MALITKVSNLFIDIKNKIKPQNIELINSTDFSKKQSFFGFDEFNPSKMEADDDITDIGIDIIQDTQETDSEIQLEQHKTNTKRVLNFLA